MKLPRSTEHDWPREITAVGFAGGAGLDSAVVALDCADPFDAQKMQASENASDRQKLAATQRAMVDLTV